MGKGGVVVEREVQAGHAVGEEWPSRHLRRGKITRHDNVNMKSSNISSCIVAQKREMVLEKHAWQTE